MINIESRINYDCITVRHDNKTLAKVYIWKSGLISNLYVRKKYRGNFSILNELANGIYTYSNLPLFGYASPKGCLEKRDALKRLYRIYGFKNITGNKMVKHV